MKSVIKLGGSVLVNTSLRLKLVFQISELRRAGHDVVLVHGGGKQIAEMLSKLNIESHFHDGLRITDAAARDVIQMVLAGKVGKDLVADFARINVPAVSTHDFSYHNINGDQMAAAVAPACEADELIFVTDVGGVKDEHGATIPILHREEINQLLESGIAYGGMRPKLRACLSALDAGVKRILIIGAAEENSLLRASRDGEEVGTIIS